MFNPLNILIGALSGAFDGKVSMSTAVDKAVKEAAQSPTNDLSHKDASSVAASIKESMPAPRAMEALWPQLMRQALVFAGGLIVARGLMSAEDWAILSGAIIAGAPVLYRVVSTWIARGAA